MREFQVSSGYRQFYVADAGLEPEAPEDWNDAHIQQRHNTLKNITALCPVGDITARVISCGPDDELPPISDSPDFEVQTSIEIETGKIGVYGWPWEIQDEYIVENGKYSVLFCGYLTAQTEENRDFYLVKVKKA